MEEQWKEIELNKNYKVSSFGRIYSEVTKSYIKPYQHKGTGYLSIGLHENGSSITKNIHRLVAEAFIPNPENKPQVNHINGIKTDNRVENLEWVTREENVQHAMKTGLLNNFGENNPNNRYSEMQIKNVCKLLEDRSLNYNMISALTGVSVGTIGAIVRDNIWENISKSYDIPKSLIRERKEKYTEQASEFIVAGMDNKQIISALNLPYNKSSFQYLNDLRRKYR